MIPPKLKQMEKSLKAWLDTRARLKMAASGLMPGANMQKAAVALATPTPSELKLDVELRRLLQEAGVAAAPMGIEEAAKYALMAVQGGLAAQPIEQGIWPIVAGIGIVAFTVMVIVKNLADKARDERHLQCVEAGACPPPTDWNMLMKIGVAGAGLWFLWAKTKVLNRFKK